MLNEADSPQQVVLAKEAAMFKDNQYIIKHVYNKRIPIEASS